MKDVVEEKKTTYYQYETDQKSRDRSSSVSSTESPKNVKQISILDKVNEIIKSCVKLKQEKQMTGEKLNKANEIIEKAKQKERKILNQLGHKTGEEECEEEEKKLPVFNKKTRPPTPTQRPVEGARKPNEADKTRRGRLSPEKRREASRSRSVSMSASLRTRSVTRSSSRSSSRTWKRGERKRSPSRRRPRSSSRDRGGVRDRSRSRSRSNLRRPRSRSWSRGRRRTQWIAVSPCVMMEAVTLEKDSTRKVSVMAKDQFWFPCNKGLSAKMTKWTGQDYIGGVHVSPQVVQLTDSREIVIEVENPYDEKVLKLEKSDKLACLSVLCTPIPRFPNSLSPDR